MGAACLPGPLSRADEAGLDTMLERLELAEREWGDGFAPPVFEAARQPGPTRKEGGQDFFFYPQPDEGVEQRDDPASRPAGESAKCCHSTNHPPTSISRQVIRDLTAL